MRNLLLFAAVVLQGCVTAGTGSQDVAPAQPATPPAVEVPPEDPFTLLKGHWDRVTVARFSSDGKRLVTGSADMTVRLWDLERGYELMRFVGHTQPVTAVAISRDGRMVASGSADNSVRVWSTRDGRELRRLVGHSQFVSALAFSDDGLKLVSGSHDKSIKLWDVDNGQALRSWRAHQKTISCLGINDAMTNIISGSDDRTIGFWRTSDGKAVWRGSGHVGAVLACSADRSGSLAISLGADRKLQLWDLKSGRSVKRLDLSELAPTASAALAPDGTRFGFSVLNPETNRHEIRIGKVPAGDLQSFRGHDGAVLAWFFAANEVKTFGTDEKLYVWRSTDSDKVK
jgi:WD40 repeat protein